MQYDLSVFDALRRARGLKTVCDILELVARGNVIFDPFSVLISAGVRMGTGNVIHPCVSLMRP